MMEVIKKAANGRLQFADMLKEQLYSMTNDHWTSQRGISYILTAMCHWINASWGMHSDPFPDLCAFASTMVDS